MEFQSTRLWTDIPVVFLQHELERVLVSRGVGIDFTTWLQIIVAVYLGA